MKHFYKSIFFLFLTFGLTISGVAAIGDDFGRISGKVVNKLSGSGLSGVTILLFEGGDVKFSTRTDGNGNFSFVNIPASSYILTAKRSSYSDFTKSVRVNARFTLKLKLGMDPLDQSQPTVRPVAVATTKATSQPVAAKPASISSPDTNVPSLAIKEVPVSESIASSEPVATETPNTEQVAIPNEEEMVAEEGEMIVDETEVILYVENPDQQPEPEGGLPGIVRNIVYPEIAIKRQLEGTVLVKVTVNQYGEPMQVEVQRSVDPSLDEAAVNTIYKTKFVPGVHNGKAVISSVAIPIKFRLKI